MSRSRPPHDATTQQGDWGTAAVGAGDRLLSGRYRLLEALGAGGSGTVFRAQDDLSGETVAVKMLLPMSTEQVARVRREIAAMRILRLPGVVRFIDEGVEDGEYFIVMELVEGSRFPGEGVGHTWDELGPRAVRLLEALALVHSAGVIHRDLKPANVLVDGDGRPRILDFGIARGPALGETITTRTVLLGTPRYLSPEQLLGQPVDARSDLYSVGVMLFEALAGRAPHPNDDFTELYTARVMRDAPAILHHVPTLPPQVALVVDRLLARRPDERPRSAAEVLADLGEEGAARGSLPRLPRLGDGEAVAALVAAASEGRKFSLSGARGSGRSRALREAGAALESAGRRICYLLAGGRPFESLSAVLGAPEGPADPGPWYRERLASYFAEGGVIAIDDAERLDRWSSSMLQGVPGPVLRTVVTGGDLRLRELTEAQLEGVFAGPARLLHLPEDGAHELFARAGGLPSRIVAEVGAWVAAGLAEWSEGRIAITRSALERLGGGLPVFVPSFAEGERPPRLEPVLEEVVAWVAMAWPDATPALLLAAMGLPEWELTVELEQVIELGAVRVLPDGRLRATVPDVRSEWPEERRKNARLALAAALPSGSQSRFGHLVAAGAFAEAGAEALLIARNAGLGGRPGLAGGTAAVGLSVARVAEESALEGELLRELTIDALRSWTVGPCERALYEVGRASRRSERVAYCGILLTAALDTWRGRGDRAQSAVGAIPPLDDEDLEVWRMTVRIAAASAPGHGEGFPALLASGAAWAEGSPRRTSLVDGWLGLARYREGRFEEAAGLHARSAMNRTDPVGRLSAALNGVAALIDGRRLAEAEPLAEQALAQARAGRLGYFEGRAEWARRTIDYRVGRSLRPDLELVEAADRLEHPALAAQIRLNEAAIAWRVGALETGSSLAAGARMTWTLAGFGEAASLAEALELACGSGPAGARRAAVARAMRSSVSRMAVQMLGLLAWGAPGDGEQLPPETWEEAALCADRFAASTPRADWGSRNEILAVDEALSYVGARRSPR